MRGSYRCIVPIKSSNVDVWLVPAPSLRAQLREILADRERPYYEHQWQHNAGAQSTLNL
ncbi:hypothetical protein BCO18430_06034 [Burkholderia contaminans]|nr:hypothetical protein BCO18430_06034 [Burkholderia contaminans]